MSDGEEDYGLRVLVPGTNTRADDVERSVDIVFVHGLTGNSLKTWKHKDAETPWIMDKAFVGDLYKKARIMTFGYNANVLENAAQSRVVDHANDLIEGLWARRRKCKGRPIVFVAHSLGGLVVKRALILCHDEDRYTDIRTMTRGVIFLGTPHEGSHQASILSAVQKVASFFIGALDKSQLPKELEVYSATTMDINRSFMRKTSSQGLEIVSFQETRPTRLPQGERMIVQQASAVLNGNGARNVGMSCNHQELCKFRSPEDRRFQDVFWPQFEIVVENAIASGEDCERGLSVNDQTAERLQALPVPSSRLDTPMNPTSHSRVPEQLSVVPPHNRPRNWMSNRHRRQNNAAHNLPQAPRRIESRPPVDLPPSNTGVLPLRSGNDTSDGCASNTLAVLIQPKYSHNLKYFDIEHLIHGFDVTVRDESGAATGTFTTPQGAELRQYMHWDRPNLPDEFSHTASQAWLKVLPKADVIHAGALETSQMTAHFDTDPSTQTRHKRFSKFVATHPQLHRKERPQIVCFLTWVKMDRNAINWTVSVSRTDVSAEGCMIHITCSDDRALDCAGVVWITFPSDYLDTWMRAGSCSESQSGGDSSLTSGRVEFDPLFSLAPGLLLGLDTITCIDGLITMYDATILGIDRSSFTWQVLVGLAVKDDPSRDSRPNYLAWC